MSREPIRLAPGAATLNDWERIYRTDAPVEIAADARDRVDQACDLVRSAAAGERAVYGVNTGFGKLASVRIPSADASALQRNLIRSHCAGVGPALPKPVVRLIMAIKAASLARGASGVDWRAIELLIAMINRDVAPVIPSQGSVGASGDLAPLAHLTAVLTGEGEAEANGRVTPGGDALAAVGLSPITLGPKEGLAFINGTQVSTALALAGLFDAWRLANASLASAALTTDAAMGSTAPLRPEIHQLRGHAGQIDAAAAMDALLDGSEIRSSHLDGDERVQDPYCIRCQPQVVGAALDLLRTQATLLETEANAVTDNPLVLLESGDIVSGGNFHAEPVAFAADVVALGVAEIGAIAQRRIALLVDPHLSFGLPAFLSPQPGLNSGFMIAEVTTAALMSENKHLATPCSTDSTPTSANQEDHVSMACHGARRLLAMNDNLSRILAVEMLAAAQGVELRAPLRTSARLRGVVEIVRGFSPALTDDRSLSADIETLAKAVVDGAFSGALSAENWPSLTPNETVAAGAPRARSPARDAPRRAQT